MENAPLIGTLNFNISAPALSPLASALVGALLRERGHEAPAAQEGLKPTPPAIGEYWPGQGGIYGGLRLYPEGMCHVIFAASDVGKHAFGDYGTEIEGTNQVDGRANTAILLEREGKHPAAIAAAGYTADGHSDFYLPASGELYHGYQYLPQAFEKAWYVSSSQFSANSAYYMGFEDGWLSLGGKDGERLVRPVRRFLQ
ncbi:hypothetical protein IAE33_000288 [Pseudomonas sp. S60]|uniref:DUF1566 domain-containing protein n=1 Tax=Pseudomonas sp. S60 TaxID=211124 RepID=UPI001F1CC748|nr:DUF1566 domain-containing protein [Pseudomonas sp. S60]MBK5008428.1 hypothetical protein [Pseudomonas sp. S60]